MLANSAVTSKASSAAAAAAATASRVNRIRGGDAGGGDDAAGSKVKTSRSLWRKAAGSPATAGDTAGSVGGAGGVGAGSNAPGGVGITRSTSEIQPPLYPSSARKAAVNDEDGELYVRWCSLSYLLSVVVPFLAR